LQEVPDPGQGPAVAHPNPEKTIRRCCLSEAPVTTESKARKPAWHEAVAEYAQPNRGKAIWQLFNTFVPYIGLWALMVYTVRSGMSYWITFALAILASGLLVRIFIFFHDACHRSFFSSSRANTLLGYLTGVLTFTPYQSWRRAHAIHHATSGNLDRRGTGDVWTMTVEEFQEAPRLTQVAYRVYRNPIVLFGLGPAVSFLLAQRFPQKGAKPRERNSVWITNLAILGIIVLASLTIGFKTYLIIQLPIILIGGALGIWLFYVQHQYKGVYWARDGKWDATSAALKGSSYYRLPKVLQWFTGNIGLHHIHHLRPRIPNYNLQECYDEVPAMQQVQPLSIGSSLSSLRMNLWDEEKQVLVSFGSL
jgi:omega-6 fatty acid desaturase (delta-12 desaturase)